MTITSYARHAAVVHLNGNNAGSMKSKELSMLSSNNVRKKCYVGARMWWLFLLAFGLIYYSFLVLIQIRAIHLQNSNNNETAIDVAMMTASRDFQPTRTVKALVLHHTGVSTTHGANFLNSIEKRTTIALMAFGNATKTPLVERCIRTIRKRGKWTGYIMLITDNIASDRYRQLQKEDSGVVLIPAQPEHMVNPEQKFLPKMIFKRIKTRLLDYLKYDDRLAYMKYVLYMDIDNVVGANLKVFMQHYFNRRTETLFAESTNTSRYTGHMAMFYEDFRGEYHSGIVVLERGLSESCLADWRHRFEADVGPRRDQRFLRKMQLADEPSCGFIKLDRHGFLLFPAKRHLRKFPPEYVTFVHIANTHSASNIPKNIQERYLVNALQLTEDEKKTKGYLAKVSIF